MNLDIQLIIMKNGKKMFLLIVFVFFYSNINSQELSSNSIGNQKENLTLDMLEIPPILSGCNSKMSKKDIQLCFNTKFKKRLNRKLKLSVFNSDNLRVGKHKIITTFKISKEGKIVDIIVHHSNSNIVNEISRALNTFRKMKPGIVNGKPVNVLYSFPLYIEIPE